ncbi:hypothetical protein PFISCL1PPCAC_25847, partial [Pristionchus fissidentatus]
SVPLGRFLPFSLLFSLNSIMASVMAAKMGAGKSVYGLAVETSTVLETTNKSIDCLEKLLKACTELKKEMGLTLADHFEKAATTAGAYGKSMSNAEAGGVYTNIQARFSGVGAARRQYATLLEANQIKSLTAFKEDIKGARAAMKALDAARKGVAVAKAKSKGKEDNPELAAANEAANAEATNVEKSTVAALTAFNQKAGQLTIEMSDKLVAMEKELNAAVKVALCPA